MAEDPEQVLVQQRIAAGRGVEEVRVEVAVHEDLISAAVSGGIANSVRNAITSIIHTNTGIRIIVMPGARMLSAVTMKLTAVATEPMPSMIRPTAQKSAPRPGQEARATSACS